VLEERGLPAPCLREDEVVPEERGTRHVDGNASSLMSRHANATAPRHQPLRREEPSRDRSLCNGKARWIREVPKSSQLRGVKDRVPPKEAIGRAESRCIAVHVPRAKAVASRVIEGLISGRNLLGDGAQVGWVAIADSEHSKANLEPRKRELLICLCGT